jgi:hypothetical protein
MTNRTDISQSLPDQSLPVANYSPAVARAVAWLGDRYLLAKPINAALRSQSDAPLQTFPRKRAPLEVK